MKNQKNYMKKVRGSLIVIFLFLASITTSSAAEIEWHSYDEGMELAASEGMVAMVYFHSSSCYWCTQMNSKTFADPDVIGLTKNFVCIEVKGDRNLLSRYHVTGYPTTIFLDSNGSEILRLPGYQDATPFKTYMEAILDGRPPSTTNSSPDHSITLLLLIIAGLWLYLRRIKC